MGDNAFDTILIVSTSPKAGRGGISTAVDQLMVAFEKHNIQYELFASHNSTAILSILNPWLFCWIRFTFRLTFLRLSGKKVIVYLHPGPIFSLFRKFTFSVVGRILGHRVVFHIHSLSVHYYLKSKIMSAILRFLLMPSDCLFVLTPWWKERLAQLIKKRTFIIPNSYSVKSIQKFPKADTDKISILTMTRLTNGKNVEYVIEAIKRLPEKYTLEIAGDGDLKNALQERVKHLDLEDRVKFLGWVGPQDKHKALMRADIFCLPSTMDSFGMVFIEAMAYRLPVVALRWGPIVDVVIHGLTGLLASELTGDSIASQLKLLENPEFRNKFGDAGFKWVERNFSHEKVSLDTVSAFSTLYNLEE